MTERVASWVQAYLDDARAELSGPLAGEALRSVINVTHPAKMMVSGGDGPC